MQESCMKRKIFVRYCNKIRIAVVIDTFNLVIKFINCDKSYCMKCTTEKKHNTRQKDKNTAQNNKNTS